MTTTFTADKYFDFLINITLPFGIAFELPLVLMFLTTLGIVNPYTIAKLRKYAYFILVIIASMTLRLIYFSYFGSYTLDSYI